MLTRAARLFGTSRTCNQELWMFAHGFLHVEVRHVGQQRLDRPIVAFAVPFKDLGVYDQYLRNANECPLLLRAKVLGA
jgi:hypothetical protein